MIYVYVLFTKVSIYKICWRVITRIYSINFDKLISNIIPIKNIEGKSSQRSILQLLYQNIITTDNFNINVTVYENLKVVILIFSIG